MILKEKISKDHMMALREKNIISKNILSVIKGEIQTLEKNKGVENLSDEEVIKILTKIGKSLRETMRIIAPIDGNGDNLVRMAYELSIIESYLPKQMSKEEIVQRVSELVNSGITQMGSIMKEFSNLPADKKMVSEIFKELQK